MGWMRLGGGEGHHEGGSLLRKRKVLHLHSSSRKGVRVYFLLARHSSPTAAVATSKTTPFPLRSYSPPPSPSNTSPLNTPPLSLSPCSEEHKAKEQECKAVDERLSKLKDVDQ